METSEERRKNDVRIAVLEEQVRQLRAGCDTKERKLETLQAFQNKAIGYALAASAAVSIAAQMLESGGIK
jgi:hypothetical protein